jgi:hypothetical protein
MFTKEKIPGDYAGVMATVAVIAFIITLLEKAEIIKIPKS